MTVSVITEFQSGWLSLDVSVLSKPSSTSASAVLSRWLRSPEIAMMIHPVPTLYLAVVAALRACCRVSCLFGSSSAVCGCLVYTAITKMDFLIIQMLAELVVIKFLTFSPSLFCWWSTRSVLSSAAVFAVVSVDWCLSVQQVMTEGVLYTEHLQ